MPRTKKEEAPAEEVVAEPQATDQGVSDQQAYVDYHDAGGPDSHRDRRRE